ncbi:MAG TPA: transglycosylase domain-containing protein [Steroidobacteraceae bacterium]|nr:transglycosylase domain-containing protein [Steroidobacteraceae bacterium]
MNEKSGGEHAGADLAPGSQQSPASEQHSPPSSQPRPLRPRIRRATLGILGCMLAAALVLAVATRLSLRDFPDSLDTLTGAAVKSQVLARDGTRLSYTLENAWNTTDSVPLAAVPPLLQTAFIIAEDQHFYEHHGVDWPARCAALWLDVRAGAALRGASSITEQVVRMIHPRPRNLWSRWVEGFEAARLDARLSKTQILEFYLNQVPYAERRRGVVQAARFYFDRGLDTLSPGEQLALAVLVRSPAGMDLRHNAARARRALEQLSRRLQQRGDLTAAQRTQVQNAPWILNDAPTALEASHFVSHALNVSRAGSGSMGGSAAGTAAGPVAGRGWAEGPATAAGSVTSAGSLPSAAGSVIPAGSVAAQVHTTLDPHVQLTAQNILDGALKDLAKRHVRDGAVLIIDHRRNEILGWVVGRTTPARAAAATATHAAIDVATHTTADAAVTGYDAVLTPRQPGSTMKPLLYALALERGWTAATLIDDAELSESIGGGQHTFHNYSHRHYGPLRLREALGNSLNIPAVKTLKFVGDDAFMERLHAVGITSLTQHPEFYGDGLALGNGEVSLYEMAQAYTVLARAGRYQPLTLLANDPVPRPEVSVFTPAVATLVGNILADPEARMLEFGRGLQFPVETAIKTGTSTDYRDAWAIAFDYQHTVAVWMGNLDGSAMDGVTGAVGPAMVLRSLFSELNRNQDTRPLPLSRDLVLATICRHDGRLANDSCESTTEWFVPGTLPPPAGILKVAATPQYRLLQPTAGLQIAHDPRIPTEFEALPMQIAEVPGFDRVDWYVDGKLTASTTDTHYPWPLQRGTHSVKALVWTDTASGAHATDDIRFYVH